MSPQQELFTALRLVAMDIVGKDMVFDFLPPDVGYPLIYMGEQMSTDHMTKSIIMPEVTQTLHVYHSDLGKRGDMSRILDAIVTDARKLQSTENFYCQLRRHYQQVLEDHTTGQPLLHGVIELTYRLSHKGV